MQEHHEEQHPKQKICAFRLRQWVIAVLACILVSGLAVLIRYGIDLISVKKTGAELKDSYYSSTAREPEKTEWQQTAIPEAAPTEEPAFRAVEPETHPEDKPAQQETSAVSAAVSEKLEPVQYPNNPKKEIGYRFRGLREKNRDIVGWLSLDKLLDEAVVQRDNSYYMTHDALKQENVNGAVFLDAAISLNTRPYTLLIYGHNMRSGAMFGCLRNYENLKYYKKSPFLTFDSLYEDGRYVIFAAGEIGLEETQAHYIDLFEMLSDRSDERQRMIEELKAASLFRCDVDVQPDDQLLLMITCVDHEDRRRVVAARRLRPWESEEELLSLIRDSAAEN